MSELPPDAWRCFLFQYLAFAALMGAGLLLLWRQGDVGLATPRRRRNLTLLVGGYALYLGVHGFFQFFVSRL